MKGNASMPNNNWPQYRERVRERPPRNGWKATTLVLFISNIVFAITTLLAYYHIINPPEARPTKIARQTTTGSVPSLQTPILGNYSAIQPGPGCDQGGGIWTPEDPPINNITCGTTVNIGPSQTRGYLYFQLPNNTAFSPNNSISITGIAPFTLSTNDNCLGIAEEGVSTGFLAEYCNNGNWSIYLISNTGVIIQTLNKGITSTRNSEKLMLTLQGTILSFSIDNETYQAKGISPIQPVKIAITYFTGSTSNSSATFENFTYIVLPS